MRTAVVSLAFILAGLTCRPAMAQGLQAGVRAGVNLSTLTSEAGGSGASFETHTGLVAGGFVTWPVFSWLELQPELLYTAKGATLDADGFSSQLLVDYVEIPLLARFPLRALGRRLYAAAGPAFGVRVRARAKAEFSGATEEIDVSDEIERSDLGVVFGGGIEMGSIVIDGRYTLGLRDIDTADDVEVKNRVVSLSIGFKF